MALLLNYIYYEHKLIFTWKGQHLVLALFASNNYVINVCPRQLL